MSNSRCKILLVDKKEKYSFLFDGLRKNKFSLNHLKTTFVSKDDENITGINLFFVVLYDYRDILELLKLKNSNCPCPIVVGSENLNILKKIKKIDSFFVVDMSGKSNLNMEFYNCIRSIFG